MKVSLAPWLWEICLFPFYSYGPNDDCSYANLDLPNKLQGDFLIFFFLGPVCMVMALSQWDWITLKLLLHWVAVLIPDEISTWASEVPQREIYVDWISQIYGTHPLQSWCVIWLGFHKWCVFSVCAFACGLYFQFLLSMNMMRECDWDGSTLGVISSINKWVYVF